MKTNWQIKKLSELCDILIGGTPSRGNKEYWKNGILPWVSIADMTREGNLITHTKEKITEKGAKESNVKPIPKGSLLFSFKLSIGKLAFTGTDLYTNEAIAGLVVKNELELDKNYLYYYISQMAFTDVTTAVKGNTLNKQKIQNIEIPLPPLEGQRRIVVVLDEKIGKLRTAREHRERAIADTEQILSRTLSEIFESGKQNGWEEKQLSEIAPIMRKNNRDFLPYVGMEDIESNTGIFLGSTDPKKVQSNTFYFDETCILYGRLRPYLNKVLVTDFKGHCSTELFPLVPDINIILRKYLWYWMTQKYFTDQAMKTAGGCENAPCRYENSYDFQSSFSVIRGAAKNSNST
jgi:type I restriction enzyme S subunit